MFRSIMVPVDGSPFGEQAFPLAAALARRAGARLELVHVHSSTESAVDEGVLVPIEAMDRWEGEVRLAESLYLRDAARRLEEREGVTARVALLGGRVVEALEAHAGASGADLIVMSTHGRGGVARAWLGSVADGLLRRVSVPLLLVKPREAEESHDVRAFCRVLVPLDGSREGEAVLEPALALASLTGASCRLLVVEPAASAETLAGPAPMGADPATHRPDLPTAGPRAYLQRLVALAEARGVRAEALQLVNASAAAAILEQTASGDCDAVAMATHGRGGAARFLLGSVTDKVVRASAVPVLVQRIPRMRVLPIASAG